MMQRKKKGTATATTTTLHENDIVYQRQLLFCILYFKNRRVFLAISKIFDTSDEQLMEKLLYLFKMRN